MGGTHQILNCLLSFSFKSMNQNKIYEYTLTKSRVLCNNSRSRCVHDYFHKSYSFPFRKPLGITMELKRKRIQHTNVHLVVPETHKVLTVWLRNIHQTSKMLLFCVWGWGIETFCWIQIQRKSYGCLMLRNFWHTAIWFMGKWRESWRKTPKVVSFLPDNSWQLCNFNGNLENQVL